MSERWAVVPGFPMHMVSSEGRVYSWHSQKFLRPGIGSHGYLKFNIAFGKTKLLHVVVAEAFLGPRPAGLDVCHEDDNRLNPKLSNLEYGTRAKNIQATVRRGTHSGKNPEARRKAWETRKARRA
jgi:hypothetical protein